MPTVFKVGDKVVHKTAPQGTVYTIRAMRSDGYFQVSWPSHPDIFYHWCNPEMHLLKEAVKRESQTGFGKWINKIEGKGE